jgi:membrane protease YdiL (CAAX protease family)
VTLAGFMFWELLLALACLALIVVANLAIQWRSLRIVVQIVLAVFGLLTAVTGLALLGAGPGFARNIGLPPHQILWAGAGLLVTGSAGLLALAPPVRRALARLIPIDPDNPVHFTAVSLSAMLVGFQLTIQISTDVLGATARGTPLHWWDLLLSEIPFLLAAFLGVGFLVRRSWGASLERLGIVTPRAWQVVLGLAAAGVFTAISLGSDQLARFLNPDLARRVDESSNRLFGQVGDPFGVAVLALSAGICEEALFRGAIQPRLGLVWTTILFAALHTQYGLSVATVTVLVLGAGMGLLRKYTNTTTSMICHVAYDALAGVSIAGVWFYLGLGVEAILFGYLALAYRQRSRALPVAS